MAPSDSDPEAASSDPDGDVSLYNPPADEGEEVASEATEEHEILHLDIPKDLARQLLDVATHLGLSPSMVASRAIDLVCDEIATVDESALSTDTLIQQYQARLDILHTLENTAEGEEGDTEGDEDDPWAAVDQIIEKAEGDA